MTSTKRKERTKQMALCLFPKIRIPDDWTGDQANAVVDLLDEISTAIWDTHETEMLRAINDKKSLRHHDQNEIDDTPPLEDDYPF